jgi:hypothetical protein
VGHLRSAEQCLDACEQLVVVEGLADVVVRADPQADDAVRRLLLGGDEQDGDVRVAAKLEAEADSVEAGHHHVERDDAGPHTLERLNGLAGVGDDVGRVALFGEDAGEQHRDVTIVLDDHHPRAGLGRDRGGRRALLDHRDGPLSHLPCHCVTKAAHCAVDRPVDP